MLTYFYVRCAFFSLNSYYMPHSPNFLTRIMVSDTELVCGKMLTYFSMYVNIFLS